MSEQVYKVLLADDVAALRRLVGLALKSSGRFQVVAEAATGVEAVAMAGRAKPDLVLLDLSMPEMDGLEALPRVLQASPASHVVVLSGFNHVRMAPVALRLGASAYLEKGLEPEPLAKALLDVLEPGAQDTVGPPPAPPPGSAPPAKHHEPPREATNSFRLLLVQADSASTLPGLLAQAPSLTLQVAAAATLKEARSALDAGGIDLVLADPRLPDGAPEDVLIDLLTCAGHVPVVALLPGGDLELVASALRLGVEDCLTLEELTPVVLARSILYAIERRRAHEARLQVRDQEIKLHRLRELEQIKNQFFNTAAHELSTPLTPIRLQVSLLKSLRRSSPDEAELRSLDILERNVQRLLHLNQDILDVARLQAGRLMLERRPVAVRALVQDTVETFQALAQSAGLNLVVESCPDIVLEADAQRIGQVLFNLVSNAIKFTPRGGTVALRVEAAGDEVRVAVRDSGVGLRPDQIAQLFQPFSQVLGKDQPRGIGSGLGLFVSRGIVELHGGSIGCESAGPGKGSTFRFDLPRTAPKAAGAA